MIHSIIDTKLNPWILKISEKERDKEINKILQIGYQAISSIKLVNNNEYLKPVVNNIETIMKHQTKNLDNLQDNFKTFSNQIHEKQSKQETTISKFADKINTLLGKSQCSSSKGQIGENFISSLLQEHFRDSTVTVKVNSARESDIHIDLNDKITPTIIVESKFYKSLVTTKEIEKFKRDMDRRSTPLGIFISLSSGIANHPRFKLEKINNNYLLFIPNAGFSGTNLIYGILFLQELYKVIISNKNNYVNIEAICENINDAIEHSTMIIDSLQKTKQDSFEIITTIRKQLDKLYDSITENDIKIKSMISKIKLSIQNEIKDITMEQPIILDENSINQIIEELTDSKHKMASVFCNIIDVVKRHPKLLMKQINKKKITIEKSDKVYCILKIMQTKINATIYNDGKLSCDITRKNYLFFINQLKLMNFFLDN